MKTGTFPVKSESKEVGVAEFPIFDTVAEAVEYYGEAKLVEVINAQTKTNAMNKVRAEKAGKPTKGYLRNTAITELLADGGLQAIAGQGPDAVEACINKRMTEIEARMEAASKSTDDNDNES